MDATVVAITGDTSVCAGPTELTATAGCAGYLWSPNGETTPSITVEDEGLYKVTVTNANGCTGSDSVNVIGELELAITGFTTICEGATTTLIATEGYTYLWNTEETTQSINVTTSGKYSVKVTNASDCFRDDTIKYYHISKNCKYIFIFAPCGKK